MRKKTQGEQHANKKIIEYAKMAASTWEEFVKDDDNEKIKNYFHLRPTNSGITIVSTLPDYEMRGITGIKTKKDLFSILNNINNEYAKITSLNPERKREVMEKLQFKSRSKEKPKNILEEKIQATMINTMSKDRNLPAKLGSQNKYIHFIASELILEKGPNRVDIVGYDEKDIYLFELKKARTKKIDQVANYVNYYKQQPQIEVLKKLLANYPINPVKKFDNIKGIMVMEDADNSEGRSDWKKPAKEQGIKILFYSSSLKYRNIA
ncbi:MAG: hypothetical protein K9M01_04540 [Candidatus Omnitrophica bacterium]|nr:hypothetical protein [Candidatus Omnitrophota bacterium]MCF7887684.1 hypothetical protein [Candidatus Omnitrophota bacterium]